MISSKNEVVFLNGKFISSQDAKLSVLEPGLLHGWGIFETMRSYGNEIIYFDEHLKRARDTCRLIGLRLTCSIDRLKKIIKETVKINGFWDAYVRLTLCKAEPGTHILVIVKKYHPFPSKIYRQGFWVRVSPFRQNHNSFLSRFKTTSYLFYQLAYTEAKERGCDEAVILNNRGYITEGARSNIFFMKDNEILTPSLECGCLNGITRKAICDLAKKNNIKLYEGNFTLQDLRSTDEAFLTNSLMGVMPLVKVGGVSVKKGLPGKITRWFIKKYKSLLRDGK